MNEQLELTQSNAQQNIEQLQNPTMGKQSTTNQQQQIHRLGTNSSLTHLGNINRNILAEGNR